jgi:subtilisin family serine protease
MRSLFSALILTSISITSASASNDLLVRRKSVNANAVRFMDRAGSHPEKVQRMQFQSREEKDAYIKSLDPSEYEWEENQIYRSTDYELASELQAQVKEDVKSDPLFANQWSIFPIANDPTKISGVDIDAIRAWSITTGSDNLIIYIMDSGMISAPEPDLINRVVGYYDGLNPGKFPEDENGHGTHVGSIVMAIGDNGHGLRGVIPGKVQIVVVRFLNASNQGNTETAISGVQFIREDFAKRLATNPSLHCIVSNSWDGGYSKMLEDDMGALADAGCVLITSAGNNGRNNDQAPDYPCNFPKIQASNLCVAATDSHDKRASFSSFGQKSVHVTAPGVGIPGIVRGKMDGNQYISGYELKSGTSQAVPHVTGVAGLVWAANEKLTAREVQNIIIKSVDRLPGMDSEIFSGGRVNAYRAVLMATGGDVSLADRVIDDTGGGGGGGCTLQVSNPNPTAPREFIFGVGFSLLLLLGLRFSVGARATVARDLRARAHQRNAFDANNP